LSLPSARLTHSTLLDSIYFRSIMVLSFHMRLKSSKWFISFRLYHQNPTCISLLPHAGHISRPSRSSKFDHSNNIRKGVQNMKLLNKQLSPLSCYFLPLRPEHLPQHTVLGRCSSLNLTDQVSRPC
jgi:hypothetical protein